MTIIEGVLATPPPALSAAQAEALAREHWRIDATARPLGSERDQNFRLDAIDGARYVLKIVNVAEASAVTDFHTQLLLHVAMAAPEAPVQRVVRAASGAPAVSVDTGGGRHAVRVVTHLEGEPLSQVQRTAALRRDLGRSLARLDRALRGYFHPGAGHALLWDLKHALRLRELLVHVEDLAQRRRIAGVLERFETRVLPGLATLRAQVIHNDVNRDNVLVDTHDRERVAAFLDFGDAVHSPLVLDLAIATAYHLGEGADPLDPVCEIAAAYHEETPLERTEVELLFDLIMTRAAATSVIASWRAMRYPQNREYILKDHAAAWRRIEQLDGIEHGAADARLLRSCGYAPAAVTRARPAAPATGLLERRSRDLGPAYRLFYEQPLHIVRGEGVWLYDDAGRPYLDVYNNVPHVGHCHPEVVAAIARQARILNTHTRYLHELVVDYAERLTALFPRGLDVCMFACTGSEANELALRLARAFTKGTGFICTEHAYHGNTSAVAEISPSDDPYTPVAHVRTVRAPDSYRATGRSPDELASYYAADLDDALASLRARGMQPAAFIADSVFSSDGIVTVPAGYMSQAVARVHAAGALYIADEVQSGFGRTGERFWGYERFGVPPDIVTLGKPMANGHPVAAVVTRREIADAFAAHAHYFNTFGGNPVSCAAGLAVLDIIEREQLQANALEVGNHLKRGLESLARRHALIGDVRGSGLFIGVELVRDRASLEPAVAETKRVVEGMKERGVLVGTDGHRGNVLKLRPPMVFSKANADQLVQSLDEALAAP